jgi:hypothetical protein
MLFAKGTPAAFLQLLIVAVYVLPSTRAFVGLNEAVVPE